MLAHLPRLRFCAYCFTKRRLSRQAGIFISAAITDDCNSLDFDQHAGLREARDRNERTAGIVALPECFFSDFDKSVAEAHVIDEYRHGDEIRQAAAGFLQGLIHRTEYLARLRLEATGQILP